jgi:hypothetical protein
MEPSEGGGEVPFTPTPDNRKQLPLTSIEKGRSHFIEG